jgi:hypothetical protein
VGYAVARYGERVSGPAHKTGRRLKQRPSLRRWKLETLLEEIRRIVMVAKTAYIIASERGKRTGECAFRPRFFAEDLAFDLRAPVPMVKQCFQKLNAEGLLYRAERNFAHDTNRNNMFFGRESGWMANSYGLRMPDDPPDTRKTHGKGKR